MTDSGCSRNCGIFDLSLWAAAIDADIQCVNEIAETLDDEGEGIEKVLQGYRFSDGKSVLHGAVSGTEAGKMNLIEYLVDQLELDVNLQDEHGLTPLHVAAEIGDYVAAAYLLDHGANYNSSIDKGDTPLHIAARKGHIEMMRLLISNGAKVEAQSLAGTPLYGAAALGLADSVEFLLENLADPNLIFDHTLPPLIVAVYSKSADCVRVLLEGGADPNISLGGLNPLVEAIFDGQTEIMISLLNAGADPNVPNFYGLAPIEIAAKRGNRQVVQALLPATTPIQDIPDWSCRGIINHINSNFFKIKWKLKREENFVEAKAMGAEAFKRGHYMRAVHWYGKAMEFRNDDPSLYSNRSFCWAHLNEGRYALDDAIKCIDLKADWPKAHYRAGIAWQLLQRYDMAVKAFERAQELDPKSKEIEKAYWEAVKLHNQAELTSHWGISIPGSDHEYTSSYM